MNLFSFLAQAATYVDASAGLSPTSLLGAAGTMIAVCGWYVGVLRGKVDLERRIIEDFKGSHTELQKKFQEQLDCLSDRQLEFQKDFQAYIAVMSDIQNMILRYVILTLKNIEVNDGGSTTAVDGVTTAPAWPTLEANDGQLCHEADGDFPTRPLARELER